jgi:hypothetical protein
LPSCHRDAQRRVLPDNVSPAPPPTPPSPSLPTSPSLSAVPPRHPTHAYLDTAYSHSRCPVAQSPPPLCVPSQRQGVLPVNYHRPWRRTCPRSLPRPPLSIEVQGASGAHGNLLQGCQASLLRGLARTSTRAAAFGPVSGRGHLAGAPPCRAVAAFRWLRGPHRPFLMNFNWE